MTRLYRHRLWHGPRGRAHLESLRKPVGAIKMTKRGKPRSAPSSAPRKPGEEPRPHIRHSSLYLPEAVYEALRETAFKERCKIHDLVMEGIGLALRKRGYPALNDHKAGRKR